MKPLCLIAILVGASLLAGTSQARTWTQAATGKQIEADFVKVDGQNVVLKLRNGRAAQVPIGALSAGDQAYIEQLASSSTGAAWPRWRGAKLDGISPDTGLLKEWPSSGPTRKWTYDQAGMGYSSFSIADGKLFTLGTRGGDLYALALNAETGGEIWASEFGSDDEKGYNAGWGGGPRSTPTYDEGKIFVLGPKGTLACLDAGDGSIVWSKHLIGDFSGEAGGWGFAESPLVDGGKVVIAPGGRESPMVALDKVTGDVIWTTPPIGGVGKAEYSSILSAELDGTRQYVKLYQKAVVGVNAENGEVVWQSEWPRGATAVIPTPVIDGQKIYVTSGYNAGSKLFEVAGSETRDLWDNKEMKNHHGGVVKSGDFVYGFSDAAGLICQSWETGEMVWNEKDRRTLKGAVLLADGMLYCQNEDDGTLTLVEAVPDGFKQHGQFQPDALSPNRPSKGKVWSHPVVVNGKLYFRDQEYITCYDVKG